MRMPFTHIGLALCLSFTASLATAASAPSFDREIKPILSQHCYACHGPDEKQRKGDLRLDIPEEAARVLAPVAGGDWRTSEFHARITHADPEERMPPTGSNLELKPEQIALLERWLEAGATFEKHWAFTKPAASPLPAVTNAAWPRNPIDYFILARLEADGIAPSPEADKSTLLRRVYLDLTGIPPTPEQVQRFLTDSSPLAYEREVDALLASPHFGERWARHWLDAARYADSNGYSIDGPRSIWKYRDWVIDAFNKDMPFDQFTVEQLAGDLVPNATPQQRTATGFHRNTLINQEGGVDEEEFRVAAVIDRVNTTATVFLGLTMACAQCHSHKYDPITHAEYYQMYAFFNSDDDTDLEFPTPEQAAEKAVFQAAQRAVREKLDARFKEFYDNELDAWYAGLSQEERDALTAERRVAYDTPKAEHSSIQVSLIRNHFQGRDEVTKQLLDELNAVNKTEPKILTSMVLAKRESPRPSFIHLAGDFTRHGEPVTPGTPAVLNPLPTQGEPTRLDLAKWLIDRENPLTARVIVNRYWMQLFGRGIVETENDFGMQGTAPTHPELLDWIATEFMGQGWSTKTILRKLVTSATYRQSSYARPDLADIDPDNRLLARQTRIRLDAEIIRDSALVASGLFNPAIGGPSVYPPQPDGVMTLGQMNRNWDTSADANRYRRGMYTYFWRATPYPSLMVFDAPDATVACTRRNRSNTPLQSLTMLNDGAFNELAKGLADRVTKESPANTNAQIIRAFTLCLGRTPMPREIAIVSRLIEEQRALAPGATPEETNARVWTQVARAILNLDEFVTRE